MRGTDRQSGMGHSQQGEPQLGEGVVDIADGGDAGDGQDAGRQGQVGSARKVRVGERRKEDMRWARPGWEEAVASLIAE